MYFIVTDISYTIVYSDWSKTWVRTDRKGDKLDILDYSDWSIERVSIDVLIKSMMEGRLDFPDFLNLRQRSDGLHVGRGYLFDGVSAKVCSFVTKDIIFRLNFNNDIVLNIELSGDRCISFKELSGGYSLGVNYNEIFDLSHSCVRVASANTLVPCKKGYKFDFGLDVCVSLYADYFTVSDYTVTREFSYMRKAELARKSLMLR